MTTFTLADLTVTITADAAHLMAMPAPSRTKFGVGNAILEVAITSKDKLGTTPDETDFTFKANPQINETIPDVWDYVWIKEDGNWRCCGNRWGGIKRFGEICGTILANETK